MREYVSVLVGAAILSMAGCKPESTPDADSTPAPAVGDEACPAESTAPAPAASGPVGAAQGNPEAEKAALAAAEAWLQLVDNGQYAKSWQETAELMRAAMTQEAWEKVNQTMGKALGKVVSRELKSQMYATSLPGAPDGQYVVIQYDTRFENKQAAVETITPMLEADGTWRVSGYYIK